MKINVHEIPKDGLLLEETKTGEVLDLERADIEFNDSVNIKAQVKRQYNSVQIRLEIRSQIRFRCSRCLEKGFRDIKKIIDTTKPVDEEKVIDLTQIAREEIILDYPLKLLCKNECKGLCFQCGKNLNRGQCTCIKEDNSKSRIPIK